VIRGVDLASWQGQPGQWHAEAGDIDFAAVKLSEYQPDGSRDTDPDAAADWAWLKASRKGRIAYLYAHPAAPVDGTAVLFLSQLDQLGLDPGDGIAIDLEVTDGRNPALVSVWARLLARTLQSALGRVPLLYTYLSFAEAGNCSGLGNLPLWIADPSSPAGHPRVPAPWKTWAIHQYSTAPLDRDLAAYPDLAAMAAALGKPAPKPVPVRAREDPVLLSKGAGAITPVAIPDDGVKRIRFLTANGTATLRYQFHDDIEETLDISWAAGSEPVAVPPAKFGLRVTRVDAGANDVSAVFER